MKLYSVLYYCKQHWLKIYLGWILFAIVINMGVMLSEKECYDLVVPDLEYTNSPRTMRSLQSFSNDTLTLPADQNEDGDFPCTKNKQCGHGSCEEEFCECDAKYITIDTVCDYKLKSQLVTWLLSFFVGGLGVDWFILARGNACYNCAGAGKCLTLGGCCVWWLVDWIRVLTGSFNDGNGQPLFEDMT